MSEPIDLVWRNGRLTPAAEAVSAWDRGFTLGDGAFETMRVEAGAPVFWAEHLARLSRGLAYLGIPSPDRLEGAKAGVFELARAADLQKSRGVARLTVTRGQGGRGLAAAPDAEPTAVVTLSRAPRDEDGPLQLIEFRDALRAAGPAAQFKFIAGYGPNIAAQRAAAAAGADDAVLFNSSGRVASISIGNIYAIAPSGAVTTPPPTEGALPGVARAALLAAGCAMEAAIDPARLRVDLFATSNVVRGVRLAEMDNGAAWAEARPAQRRAAQALDAAFNAAVREARAAIDKDRRQKADE